MQTILRTPGERKLRTGGLLSGLLYHVVALKRLRLTTKSNGVVSQTHVFIVADVELTEVLHYKLQGIDLIL